MDDAASQAPAKQIMYENTYIQDPRGYGERFVFKRHEVLQCLRQAMRERVEGQKYDPIKGAQHAKQLADDLREKVKALGYDRHKLVIQVTVGQKAGQAVRDVARCLWDTTTDGAAFETYENETMFCTCEVFGLYYE